MSGPALSRRRSLLLAAIVAAGVLASIEAMLQLAYRLQAGTFLFERNLVPMLRASATHCYANQPDLALEHRTSEFSVHIYTNAQGLRTDAARRSVAPEKPPGVTRILFLGPSFTFGWGSEYEDSFVARIGAALGERGHAVEVVNAGVPGHPSSYQLCWLRDEGWRLEPDLVVYGDYGRVGGVAEGCPERLECPVIEDGLVYTVPPTLALRAVAFAKNFGIVWYGWQLRRLFATAAPAAPDAAGKELRGGDVEAAEVEDPEALAERFRRFTRSVQESVGREIPVHFVYIPLAFVVHPEDLPRWRHIGVADALGPRVESARRVAALRERGIPIVDATDLLLERGRSQRMYYWLDIHLTPAGNAAVAEAALPPLEAALSRRGAP